MPLKTPADGAAAERRAWMRHLAVRLKYTVDPAVVSELKYLIIFGKTRAKRCQEKPGGLGRKKAAK